MLWHMEDQVEVLNYSLNHVSVRVDDPLFQTKWLLTRFYGELDTSK